MTLSINGETFPPGPWDNEPAGPIDETDSVTGYPLRFHRNHAGAWCGYVGIDMTHPCFGHRYDDAIPALQKLLDARMGRKVVSENMGMGIMINSMRVTGETPEDAHRRIRSNSTMVMALEVHGEVTYSDTAFWTDDKTLWWIGFDTIHSTDMTPLMNHDIVWDMLNKLMQTPRTPRATYRTLDYVRAHARGLALQLAVAAGRQPLDPPASGPGKAPESPAGEATGHG